MGNIIDLQSADRPEIFDRANTDGLFGRKRRLQRPLGQYLREAETPSYLASNDRSGVIAAQRDSGSLTPAGDYRAYLLATTVRVLFVVGDDDSDRTISLPHEDIVAVHCTSGLRTSTLEIVTIDEDRWAFECKGDLTPVRSFVDEATQVWTRTLTELDRAESAVEAALAALETTDLETAATHITAAQEALDNGRERVEALGEGARAAIDGRLQSTQTRIDTCQRRRHVDAGDEHRDTARRAWENRAYERAADAYAQAGVEYERALAVTASEPPTELIRDARNAVEAEYTELLSAPVDAAQVAASAARATADPAKRARHWEDALDRYRTAYELDWGRDRRFDGNRASLRQALADIAVELVDAHREAGRQALQETGDESEREPSGTACDSAAAHFERARQIATELVPDRREPPADELAAVSGQGASVEAEQKGR
ncbi:hypothetical protein SAMN05443574_11734 [Haloarcula vallismortis]|uniref:YokE-like PH domain-containing protein n=2 Tax=Haloarcula vallismortis TaxID=28442 RepID=M0JLV8_HALVA|nr:hypothetical protein [Haloarcula vallismortis]EMA08660.1 hypothetical protein C437_08242 [Haloarcula vallismortis ATCC 29715]SDX18202.1 hypothetical protein SAMN05443574_11734 [Haloarcula vallismortis]